ncbi:hypothetical protein [Paraburkholderia sp. C35]|uniref:hypothetical protein n=1 Tax=Paraburkholderia sp. C35 TaxID=2126993 RepID=UPI000D693A3E|nr:hypothetical protein [Paraburkholderia sp. C35]
MNPNAYVPPDAAVWMNLQTAAFPTFEPLTSFIVVLVLFAFTAMPTLAYVVLRLRAAASQAAAARDRENDVPSKPRAKAQSGPGAIHLLLALVMLPFAVIFGAALPVYAAAWWVAGAYDCSSETPMVEARLGVSDTGSNLCMNVGAHVQTFSSKVKGEASRTQKAAGHILSGDE